MEAPAGICAVFYTLTARGISFKMATAWWNIAVISTSILYFVT
jgi:hypothetical protein